MKKYAYIILSVFLFVSAMMVTGCDSSTTEDKIDIAYAAFGDKDMERAQHEVLDVMENDSINVYSCLNLCRLSIILMKLSEQGYEENIPQAVHCYYRSFEVNADSATEYFATLPVEDAPFVTILSALSVSLDPEQEVRMEEFEVNENDIDIVMQKK